MRCFIAIELPENIKAKIFHEFETLKEKNLFGGKFVGKENLHLTLRFLGDLSKEKIEEVKERLRGISLSGFKCMIGRSGFFKDEKRIRVIWIEVILKSLEKFEKKISDVLPEFPNEHEKFSPHITVARVEYIRDRKGLIENIKNIHLKNLNFDVDEFVLMKSELMGKSQEYRVLERFELD
ncbi:RNA 2',3'-cyclic phosphodiesterase [Candidatus Pacearchaeota archaeon]|nr:RNA 2',3'-cyclic phosphodiesterase [Candidatus Pacearchaeota archaeon]